MPASLKITVPWAAPGWGKLDAINRQFIENLVQQAGVFIGEDPPPNAHDGQLWWRTVDGDMYVYYTDSTSSQWVAATSTPGTPPIAPLALLAPIDFPSNPNLGDIFESPSGVKYQWDGVVWVKLAGVGGLVPIDNLPPPNPQPGQLWWRNEDTELYIYYFDGTTGQWVEASGGAGAGSGGGSLPLTGGTLTGDLIVTNFQNPGHAINLRNYPGGPQLSLHTNGTNNNSIIFSRQGQPNPDWIILAEQNRFSISSTVITNNLMTIFGDSVGLSRPYTTTTSMPVDPEELTSKAYVDAAVIGGARYIGICNAPAGTMTDVNGATFPIPTSGIANGMYLVCSVAGTLNLPGNPGITSFIMRIGDQLFNNGQAWMLVPVGAEPPNMSVLFSNRGPWQDNLDDVFAPGSYRIMSGATGTPIPGADLAFLNHFVGFNLPGSFVQEFYQLDTVTFEITAKWTRAFGNDIWNPWQRNIIEDAPTDGRDYVRRNNQWVPLP